MNSLIIICGVLALFILIVGWRFVHQLKRKRFISGILWSTQGVILFLAFLITLLVFSNLHTYQRLTYEAPVADIFVHQLARKKFQLLISHSDQDKDQQYFVLQGDQWQLDARILKWKGWANLLGLDSFYQLDRLSGRYADVAEARRHLPDVYDLTTESRGLDVWKLKQLLRDKLSFVDAVFGQGVFMPLLDGAHYQLFMGQSGLLVRPVNDIAKSSLF